jgi:glycosyltransferase involved in cell wall biosynthesis
MEEAANLPDCLKSVSSAKQIVVVDSGSTNGILEIAGKFGCEVFSGSWKGFGPQKQAAIDRCREPWVLVHDADKRIPPETQTAIRAVVSVGEGRPRDTASPGRTSFSANGYGTWGDGPT